jgi:signal transduction histidine kinase
MSLAAAAMILWAVRRLTRPVGALAAAAERLGRDVNAPALPEDGPHEIAVAARAFNTMAGNIRRFVADRTLMLAAIGHDLRTPITRLRLRAELLDDENQRARMLADLAEMEGMIGATLAFARDDAAQEPALPLDLAALVRTVLDEAADSREGAVTAYAGPERMVLPLRPVAMKRALANLVGNALAYGGAARATLSRAPGEVLLLIEDDGPGIPEDQLEQVFEPFRRLEASRNRETGGTGLGLTIARSIIRAHGGDVRLQNRTAAGCGRSFACRGEQPAQALGRYAWSKWRNHHETLDRPCCPWPLASGLRRRRRRIWDHPAAARARHPGRTAATAAIPAPISAAVPGRPARLQ